MPWRKTSAHVQACAMVIPCCVCVVPNHQSAHLLYSCFCGSGSQELPLLPGLLLQQLQAIAASSRVAAALNILHWLQLVADSCSQASAPAGEGAAAEAAAANVHAAAAAAAAANSTFVLSTAISSVVPEQLPDCCLAYLSAPGACMPSYPSTEPYAELGPFYARMRRELCVLVNACHQVGGGSRCSARVGSNAVWHAFSGENSTAVGLGILAHASCVLTKCTIIIVRLA